MTDKLNEYLKPLSREDLELIKTDRTVCMKVVYKLGIPRCDVLSAIDKMLADNTKEINQCRAEFEKWWPNHKPTRPFLYKEDVFDGFQAAYNARPEPTEGDIERVTRAIVECGNNELSEGEHCFYDELNEEEREHWLAHGKAALNAYINGR